MSRSFAYVWHVLFSLLALSTSLSCVMAIMNDTLVKLACFFCLVFVLVAMLALVGLTVVTSWLPRRLAARLRCDASRLFKVVLVTSLLVTLTAPRSATVTLPCHLSVSTDNRSCRQLATLGLGSVDSVNSPSSMSGTAAAVHAKTHERMPLTLHQDWLAPVTSSTLMASPSPGQTSMVFTTAGQYGGQQMVYFADATTTAITLCSHGGYKCISLTVSHARLAIVLSVKPINSGFAGKLMAPSHVLCITVELLRSDNGTLGSHALPVINAPLALLEEVNTVASGFHGELRVALAHASRTIHELPGEIETSGQHALAASPIMADGTVMLLPVIKPALGKSRVPATGDTNGHNVINTTFMCPLNMAPDVNIMSGSTRIGASVNSSITSGRSVCHLYTRRSLITTFAAALVGFALIWMVVFKQHGEYCCLNSIEGSCGAAECASEDDNASSDSSTTSDGVADEQHVPVSRAEQAFEKFCASFGGSLSRDVFQLTGLIPIRRHVIAETLLYSEDPLDVQIRGEWAMSRPAQFISYCMAYVEDREQEGWGDGGSLDIMKSRIARANEKSEQEMRKHLQEFRDRHKAPSRLRTDGVLKVYVRPVRFRH